MVDASLLERHQVSDLSWGAAFWGDSSSGFLSTVDTAFLPSQKPLQSLVSLDTWESVSSAVTAPSLSAVGVVEVIIGVIVVISIDCVFQDRSVARVCFLDKNIHDAFWTLLLKIMS